MGNYEKLLNRQRELKALREDIQCAIGLMKNGKGIIKLFGSHDGVVTIPFSSTVIEHLTEALQKDLEVVQADKRDIDDYITSVEASVASVFPHLDCEVQEEDNGANF